MAQNSLSNFNRQLPKEPSCEIISKSVHRFSRRSHLKPFSIYSLAASLFKGAEPFEQFSVEGYPRNISVKLFQNLYTSLAEAVVKYFLYL